MDDEEDKEYKDDLAEWNNSPYVCAIRVLGIDAGFVNHPLGPLGDDGDDDDDGGVVDDDDELGQDDDDGVVDDDDDEYFVV